MKKRTLGRSDPEVSAIGLGRMGMSFGYGPPADRHEMIALIRAAVARGVTSFAQLNAAVSGIEIRGARLPEQVLVFPDVEMPPKE